jgi:CRISPR-associated endonuclease Csn1
VIARAATAGSTVRGQLHNETFYGKIKKPGETETICVVRKELNSANFSQLSALDKIVDPAVRQAIQDEINRRGGDFKKAMDAGGFTMTSGMPIKKVRIEATTVTNPKALSLHVDTVSKQDYKNPYWVQAASGSNFRLAVYKGQSAVSGADEFVFCADNLLDFVQQKNHTENGQLVGYILPGAMAIAFKHKDEWLEPDFNVWKRLYDVVKFTESNNTITLRFHREARRMKDLSSELIALGKKGAGQSSVEFDIPHELLQLNFRKAWGSFLFEGIHFTMGLDGKIEFKN